MCVFSYIDRKVRKSRGFRVATTGYSCRQRRWITLEVGLNGGGTRQGVGRIGGGVRDRGEGRHREREIDRVELVERVGRGVVPVEVGAHILVHVDHRHRRRLQRDQIGAAEV